MSVRLRLTRMGAKKRPFYRIVAADARAPRDGRIIERLGHYDPMVDSDENRLVLNEERIRYWLGVGAQPTDRVQRFLSKADLCPPRPRPQQTKKHLPKAKAQERLQAKKDAQDG